MKGMRRAACPFLLALVLGWPSVARSQSDPPPAPPQEAEAPSGPPPVFYETTTVTARPVATAVGSVTVVDERDLAASAARSGTEVLREVPGLNLLASGGRAGVTNAWVRGADPNFTLVLLDGIPLNDSTELQGGAVNLEELSSTLVGRAEMVRGPLTSFYGPSSLSGVVQLFTPRGGPGPLRLSLGAEAGNADLRRGFARASGGAGRGGWSAGVAFEQEAGRIADDRFRQLSAYATTDLSLGDSADLGLTARVSGGEQDDYPESSGGPVYGTGETRHTDHDDLALGARLLLGGEAARRQQLTIGLARRVQDRASPAVFPLVPESVERTAFTRLRLAWQLPVVRAERTSFDVGVSGEGEWGENRSELKLPPFLGGDVAGDYDAARGTAGVLSALRHERGPLLYELALRADVASGDSVQLHPHAGVVFRPGAGRTRLHASAGRASKLPSFFALSSPPALGGNPDLKPERTVGGELGVEQALAGGRLVLGAVAFLHEYRDLVDFDFDLFTHVNRAQVRTRGAELVARWQPHPTLTLEGEATYVDAEDRSGDPLLYEPRWLGGGRLSWRPSERLSLRLDARVVSHYLDRQLPVPERDAVDGYGLVGFAGSWRFRDGLTLRARLDNLANRSYETLIGFPGPGRSFWVGLGWDRS
jgi:outer membrane cobalamin receptor